MTASCSDLAIVGRVFPSNDVALEGRASVQLENSVEEVALPDWYSGYDVKVRIKRVLHGTEQRKTIPASFVYHGYPRDDVDMMIVLSSDDNGGYAIKSLNLARGTRLRVDCPA
ncbi:hypothetical protein [Brevundimonas sp. GN22]